MLKQKIIKNFIFAALALVCSFNASAGGTFTGVTTNTYSDMQDTIRDTGCQPGEYYEDVGASCLYGSYYNAYWNASTVASGAYWLVNATTARRNYTDPDSGVNYYVQAGWINTAPPSCPNGQSFDEITQSCITDCSLVTGTQVFVKYSLASIGNNVAVDGCSAQQTGSHSCDAQFCYGIVEFTGASAQAGDPGPETMDTGSVNVQYQSPYTEDTVYNGPLIECSQSGVCVATETETTTTSQGQGGSLVTDGSTGTLTSTEGMTTTETITTVTTENPDGTSQVYEQIDYTTVSGQQITYYVNQATGEVTGSVPTGGVTTTNTTTTTTSYDANGVVTDVSKTKDGETPYKEGDQTSVTGGGDCASAPVCSGDAVQCAILKQTYLTRCPTEDNSLEDAFSSGLNDFMTGTGQPETDTEGTLASINAGDIDVTDLAAGLVNADGGYAGQCPAPRMVTLSFITKEFSYEAFCNYAIEYGDLVYLFGLFGASLTLMRGITGG